MFDGYVFVDKIPKNDSAEPAVHIYTRPFDLSSVMLRDSLSIYTTAILKSVMVYGDKNSMIHNSIKILNEGDVPFNIELPNGKTLWINTFACGSKTLNVVVSFEYCDRHTLYAGRFIASNSTLFKDARTNVCLRNLMRKKKIDDLFVDATTAHIFEVNLKFNACNEIESLIKSDKFKDYNFKMLINDFGYEDLLFMLAKRKIEIYLDDKRVGIFRRQNLIQHFCNDPHASKIILVDKFSYDVEKQFTENKIISIELTPDNKISDSQALQFIKFSVHPTVADISFIASLAAPLHIYTIGHSIDFPFPLNYLCRFDENSNKKAGQKNQQQKS